MNYSKSCLGIYTELHLFVGLIPAGAEGSVHSLVKKRQLVKTCSTGH